MKLHELKPAPGSRKPSKRVGRGLGSGRGTYATRGVKGQKARTGHHGGPRPGFEGGQTPLINRLPKLPGFKNPNYVDYQVINLKDLERFSSTEIKKENLKEKGLIGSIRKPVKLLGFGNVSKAYTVEVDAASSKAEAEIKKAGGKLLMPPKKEKVTKKVWTDPNEKDDKKETVKSAEVEK